MLTDTKSQCRNSRYYVDTVVLDARASVDSRASVDAKASVDATLYIIVWAPRKAPSGPLPVTAHYHYHDLGYRQGMLHIQ